MNDIMLLAVVPTTAVWSVKVAIIMIASNLVAIAIGKYAIQSPGAGPGIPGLPAMFSGFGIPELLATTALGHIIGAGIILGVSSAGVL